MESKAASDLLEYGVAVLPIMDEGSRSDWNNRIFEAMDTFPEYKVKGRTAQRVLGGFGAFGNPSSFHDPTIRAFRRALKRLAVRPMMQAYAKQRYKSHRDVKLEALFDRICVRCDDFNSPSAESWHRDIYDSQKYRLRALPHSLPGDDEGIVPQQDLLIGGWTNLDHREQKFVGIPGSHDEIFPGGKGFAQFSEADVKRFGFAKRLASQSGKTFGHTISCNKDGEIRVPPAHAIFFLQRLVHAVKAGPQPDTPALRVFHGFRLTTEDASLFDHEGVLANGAVPRIPSGQIPPMYSQNHYAAFALAGEPRWREWAARTFYAVCLFERTLKTGKKYFTPGSRDDRNAAANKGRYMPSLSEMGLMSDRFEYSRDEIDAIYPQSLFY